jgi:hypothetical protein
MQGVLSCVLTSRNYRASNPLFKGIEEKAIVKSFERESQGKLDAGRAHSTPSPAAPNA